MVGAIYDDFIHIEQACTFLAQEPYFRPLIYSLTCGLGESLILVRLTSLCLILLSIPLVGRLLGLRTSWIVALHPLVLFPVFYASQVSTALSVFLALCFCYYLLELLQRGRYEMAIPLTIVSLMMLASRAETFIFAWIILFIVGLYRESTNQRRQLNMLALSGAGLLAALFFLGFLLAHPLMFGDLSALYELNTWAKLIGASAFQYYLAFLIPFAPSFFGPWAVFSGMSVSFTVALVVLMAITFFSKRKLPSLLLFTFFFCCTAQSLVPRFDWYFLSRAYLASMLALPMFLAHFPRWSVPRALIAGYLALALTYTYLAQYRDTETFIAYEIKSSGGLHPAPWMMRANEYLVAGEYSKAYAAGARAKMVVLDRDYDTSLVARNWRVRAERGMKLCQQLIEGK